MDERKSQPTVLLLLLALLGVYTLPRVVPQARESAAEAKAEAGAESAGATKARADDAGKDELAPLSDLVWDGAGPRPTAPRDLVDETRKAHGRGPSCLIALVPDPVRTSNSFLFDTTLDGIQRAVESMGFVLDRYRFPWHSEDAAGPARANGEPAREHASINLLAELSLALPATPSRPAADQPGLIVFRDPVAEKPDPGAKKPRPPLLVFLVAETPTYGLNKPQLARALDLVHELQRSCDPPGRPIAILGPSFSGTQTSLRQALVGWCRTRHPAPVALPLFRVVAGGATDVDGAALTAEDRDLPAGTIAFETTQVSRAAVVKAMTKFLEGADRIALLVEANTGFGNATADNPKEDNDVYIFPLHISELRTSYEQRGLLDDRTSQVMRSAGRLPVPLERPGPLRDILRSETPEQSTKVDDLVLMQTLGDIAAGQYGAVGIVATNPRDAVFLANQVRGFRPDVALFTCDADLAYTEPQTIADLRGMLVGSAYPLYTRNRAWSYPFAAGPRELANHERSFFHNDTIQGIYNATLVLLRDELKVVPEHGPRAIPAEYGSPFTDPGARTASAPPIWIGTVGYRGLYPLHVEDTKDSERRWTHAERPATREHDPSRWFRPTYHPFWMAAYLGLLLLAAALAGLAWLELAPEGLGRGGAIRAWVRAGSGGWLLAGHVGLLLAFLGLSWPLLERRPPGVGPDRWTLAARLGFLLVTTPTLALLAARWWGRWGRRRRHRLMLASLAAAVGLLACWLIPPATPDTWLALERAVVVTSGVSPTWPIVFAAVSVGCGLFAHVARRRRRAEADVRPAGLATPEFRAFRCRQGRLVGLLRDPWRALRLASAGRLAVFAGLVGAFVVLAIGRRPWSWSPEPRLTTLVFWALFAAGGAFVLFDTLLLSVVWGEVAGLLHLAAQLPMVRAFDRLPARVAQWFFEPGGAHRRSDLIREQARALAARDIEAVRSALEAVLPGEADAVDWPGLRRDLLAYDRRARAAADRALVPILRQVWAELPVTWAYADQAAKTDGKAGWPLATAGPAGEVAEADALRAWVEAAEDLLALRMLRRLSRALAHVWSLIGTLVVGVSALLLAINSYPFPRQSLTRTVLVLIVLDVAAVVLRVMLGINRDELISRVSNTLPYRLKLDRNLGASLLAYILPLVGVLATISYDVSDLIRSWLDPVLRNL